MLKFPIKKYPRRFDKSLNFIKPPGNTYHTSREHFPGITSQEHLLKHCENRIVKITNILISTVARIL